MHSRYPVGRRFVREQAFPPGERKSLELKCQRKLSRSSLLRCSWRLKRRSQP
jgi:hypothetical protein